MDRALREVDNDMPWVIARGLMRGGIAAWDAFAERLLDATSLAEPALVVLRDDYRLADVRSYVAWCAQRAGRRDLVEDVAQTLIANHSTQVRDALDPQWNPTGWTLGDDGMVNIVVERASESETGFGVRPPRH